MDTLSRHYHQLVGLNSDWVIASVDLDVKNRTLTLGLAFVGARVVCPECGAECAMKDHAAEPNWHHLDAMQFQMILTARIPRCSCEKCGVKTISLPWAEKHSRFTLLFEAVAIDVLHAGQSIQPAAMLLGIDLSTAQGIMKREVDRGLERRSLDEVRHVGIDEKSFGKRHDYVGNFRDLSNCNCRRYFATVPRSSESNAEMRRSEEPA